MTELVILTDGGKDIGFGHLMRCLAIKDAWDGGSARVLAQMEGDSNAPKGAEVINWIKNRREIEGFVSHNSILLVDSYRPDYDFFLYLKKLFPFIVVLDDYNRITYPVDLIICPATYGNQSDYSNQLATVFGGPEYVILRPDIRSANQIHIKDKIEKILITFGGSQKDGKLYQYVNDTLEQRGYKADVVTGSDSIAREVNALSSRVYGRLDADSMYEVMSSADLAISAAGQTLNELAWLGVPAISIKTGEDQHNNWDYYGRHNLVLASILPEEPRMERILNKALEASKDTREKLSYKLRDIFQADGASKVCTLIYNTWNCSNG